LAASDADFDWTGIQVVASAISQYRALPWRMSADDYLDAVAAG
jgi:hypothetical protein